LAGARLQLLAHHRWTRGPRRLRLRKQALYLAVEDLPPQREKPAMTAEERSKLQKELIAARDRQTFHVEAREGAARPKPVTP